MESAQKTRAENCDALGADRWTRVSTGALAAGVASALPGMVCFVALLAGVPPASPVLLLFPVASALLLVLVTVLSLRGAGRGGAAWAFPALAFAAVQIPFLLLPPVFRDELVYHLAVPARWLREGATVDLPFMRYSYYPMLVQAQYVGLLARDHVWAARLLHLCYGVALSALLCGTLSCCRIAPAVALALLTAPAAGALLGTAYVDLALAFYVAVAVAAWLRWSERGGLPALALLGLACGAAGAVKYSGFLYAAWAVILVVLTTRRRPLCNAALVVLLALLPAAPWLGRNAYLTGDPFYPLLADWLGWRPAPESAAIPEIVRRRLLYGESWLEVLCLPLRVFTTGVEGDPRRFDGVLTPLCLLAPLALAYAGGRLRRALLLYGIGSLFSAILFASRSEAAFQARFLLPVCFPLLLLAAVPLEAWWRGGTGGRILAGGLLAAVFAFHLGHAIHHWRLWDPLAPLAGRTSTVDYVTRFWPEYRLAVWAGEHVPEDSVVYLGLLGSRGLFWRQRYVYDDNYLAPTLLDAVRRSRDAAAVGAVLRSLGIEYLALSEPRLARYLRDNLEPAELARWERFVRAHLELVRRDNGVALYAIRRGDTVAAPKTAPGP